MKFTDRLKALLIVLGAVLLIAAQTNYFEILSILESGGGTDRITVVAPSIASPATVTWPNATSTLSTLTLTETLENKRITYRIQTLTDAATVTPDTDSYDGGLLATLSQTTTIENPTGTPTNFQQYKLRIKSSTTRTLNWGAQFRGSADMALPTATSGSNLTDYLVFQWNSADSKWDCLGRNFGF